MTSNLSKQGSNQKRSIKYPFELKLFSVNIFLKALQHVYGLLLPYLIILWLHNSVINNTSIVNSSWNLLWLRLSVKHKEH